MNPSRRPLIVGNWKMHHGGPSGVELAADVARHARDVPRVDVVVAPPYTALAACAHECDGSHVEIAAQNLSPEPSGAFTGEISATMLLEAGCRWVIVGHSERRQLFGETDAIVARKVAAALKAGLLEEREGGRTTAVVERQVRAFLGALAESDRDAAIAYEPVWAIGTGKTAGPAEAQEVHAAIRAWLAESSAGLAPRTRILYGGSVKPDNARALLAERDVDGALVGGASLDRVSFGSIIASAESLAAA